MKAIVGLPGTTPGLFIPPALEWLLLGIDDQAELYIIFYDISPEWKMKTDRKRILLIGNDLFSLKTLAEACRKKQLATVLAPGVDYALEEMEQRHYDLFVLDLDLKRKPSIDLVQAVDHSSPDTPIILLTTDYIQSQDLIFGLDQLNIKGTWHLLEKPFQPELLSNLVSEVLAEEDNSPLSGQTGNSEADRDKRKFARKAQFQPIRFSYEREQNGSRFKTFARGLLTDIGSGGIGLLTNRSLTEQQTISFENSQLCGSGRVVWSAVVDDLTRKIGVMFR